VNDRKELITRQDPGRTDEEDRAREADETKTGTGVEEIERNGATLKLLGLHKLHDVANELAGAKKHNSKGDGRSRQRTGVTKE